MASALFDTISIIVDLFPKQWLKYFPSFSFCAALLSKAPNSGCSWSIFMAYGCCYHIVCFLLVCMACQRSCNWAGQALKSKVTKLSLCLFSPCSFCSVLCILQFWSNQLTASFLNSLVEICILISQDGSNECNGTEVSRSGVVLEISIISAVLFVVVASCFLIMLYKLMSSWFIEVLVVLFSIGGVEVCQTKRKSPSSRIAVKDFMQIITP